MPDEYNNRFLFLDDLPVYLAGWTSKYIAAASTNALLKTTGRLGGITVGETAAGAITVYHNYLYGDSTSRFDITEIEAGVTYRYTWDGTGTDPGWSAASMPLNSQITFAAQNFSAGNNGTFTITGAGANWIEVANANGVAEADKTIGTGNIRAGSAALTVLAVLKASIAEGNYLTNPIAVTNGLTVVTAAASKIVVCYK